MKQHEEGTVRWKVKISRAVVETTEVEVWAKPDATARELESEARTIVALDEDQQYDKPVIWRRAARPVHLIGREVDWKNSPLHHIEEMNP